ncbi:MAG: FKBP-type peptidyl-prolyl cis-trans isomerase [Desulfobulbales bacterium]
MRKVQQGDQVIIEFEGRLQDGEVVESSSENGPAEFTVGEGVMPTSFEEALVGMVAGEKKSIILSPTEAFGHKDENLLHTVKKSAFGKNIEPQPGMVLGMTVQREGQTQKIPALITAVSGDDVTIDFNHPLAGRTMHYNVTLISIKD